MSIANFIEASLNKPAATPSMLPATTTPQIPIQAPSYFYALDPKTGNAIGRSDQLDPYSGRPLFAYKLPGQGTTTDPTRVATTFDPRVATITPRDQIKNPRMPEYASESVRKTMGATPAEQLDHAMALAVGGSNTKANLRLIPTAQNQAAGSNEAALENSVASGKMSLFQAQMQEAKAKGLPTPFTDQPKAAKPNILMSLSKLPSEILGILNPFL